MSSNGRVGARGRPRRVELTEAEGEIRGGLERSAGRQLARAQQEWRTPGAAGIPTLPEFGDTCAALAAAMFRRFLRTAPAQPPAGPLIERPRLGRADPDD